MKIYILKSFWDHERKYFVLVRAIDRTWEWINVRDGSYFSRGHNKKKDSFPMAQDQGVIIEIQLKGIIDFLAKHST